MKKRRAVSSPPIRLCRRKPPDRRSGRIPALPYPPLEHEQINKTSHEEIPSEQKSGFDRTSGFANYKPSGFADTLSGFANYICPVLIAPRQQKAR
jgi:hypothetical protein